MIDDAPGCQLQMKAPPPVRKVKDLNVMENSCCSGLQSQHQQKKTMIGEHILIIFVNIVKEDHEEDPR